MLKFIQFLTQGGIISKIKNKLEDQLLRELESTCVNKILTCSQNVIIRKSVFVS